jgi:hypothetical protein
VIAAVSSVAQGAKRFTANAYDDYGTSKWR